MRVLLAGNRNGENAREQEQEQDQGILVSLQGEAGHERTA